jgi:hypothetical protein
MLRAVYVRAPQHYPITSEKDAHTWQSRCVTESHRVTHHIRTGHAVGVGGGAATTSDRDVVSGRGLNLAGGSEKGARAATGQQKQGGRKRSQDLRTQAHLPVVTGVSCSLLHAGRCCALVITT